MKWIKYIPFGLLVIAIIKSLIIGITLNDVCLIAILAGLTAFYETTLSDNKTQKLQEQINTLIKHNQLQDKSIDDLKSSIVSVKVSSGIRGLTK